MVQILKDKQALLAVVVAVTGFYLSTRTSDPALTIRHWGWGVWTLIFFVWLVAARKCDLRVLRMSIFVFMLSFLLITVSSGMIAVNTGEWVYQVCKAIVFPMFVLVCVFVITDHRKFSSMMAILALCLFWWGVGQSIRGQAMTGRMAGANLFPQAMFMLLPFCFMVPKKWWRLGVVAGVSIIMAIVKSGTRSVIAAVVVFGVVVAISRKKHWIVLLLLIVIITGALLFESDLFNSVSLERRMARWSESLRMPTVGAGQWKIIYPAYGSTSGPAGRFVTRAHNDFVEVLVELGYGGLVCYFAVFGLGIYYAARCRLWYLVAGICGYMVIAFFSFPRERAFCQMILCIYFSIAVRSRWLELRPTGPVRRYWIISVVMCGMLVFCCYDFWVRYRAEQVVAMVKVASAKSQWNRVRNIIDANYHPLATVNNKTTPLMWFRGLASEGAGDIDGAIVDYRKALQHNPNHIFVLNNLGAVLIKRGRFDEASECFAKAIYLKPRFKEANKNFDICQSWIEARDGK